MGQPPQFSPDGRWFWDGARWQPAVSPDGKWRWNGYTWVASPGGLSTGWMIAIASAVVIVLLAATVPIVLLIGAGRNSLAPSAARPSPSVVASPSPKRFTNIPCDQLEHTEVHYHVYLQIINNGEPVPIPTDVGRSLDCYYWLHMHTNEEGIIHVESPADRVFTLGDFFDVWSDWGGALQPLDSMHLSTFTLTSAQKLVVYVDLDDGKGPSAFTGDPRSIVLKVHEMITLEITPPAVNPPPSFTWPTGF